MSFSNDSKFLAYLRSLSIFVIVFGHVGGFWVFQPYSGFLYVFVPIFFFLSGAVSFLSFTRSSDIKEYYLKRFSRLLIPYYLLCILSLVLFVALNHRLPSFDIVNILKWIQINPSKAIMPFPVGQVWFLNTLLFITLISPLYFIFQNRNKHMLSFILFIIIVLSTIQLLLDIDAFFMIMDNNLYKPIIHSCFYIFGIKYIASNKMRDLKFMSGLFVLCIVTSICFAYCLDLKIDYIFHTYAPDIYYVTGSLAAIIVAIIFQEKFIIFLEYYKLIEKIFLFFHKHTFSIFLLHTFSIYFAEKIDSLVDPDEKSIVYGIIKLIVVLTITCILSVPFTKFSALIISFFSPKKCFTIITPTTPKL